MAGFRAFPPAWVAAGMAVLGTQAMRASAQTSTTTSYAPQFTVPFDIDNGAHLLPNIYDPGAADPQDVCPGYTASNVVKTSAGFTADLALAGDACNVYGNDVDALTLIVEYQAQDRLHVEIKPSNVDASNETWYDLPAEWVNKPGVDADNSTDFDLAFSWTNDPSFGFNVTRVSTGDVIFSTDGYALVFEDQFVSFVSSLPEDYNLYGLGETIHAFRLGTNFTKTMWNADVGDNVDA